MADNPVLKEVAAGQSSSVEEFPEHILRSEAFAACGGDLFALYEEMEEKDSHLFAALQTRKNGLLARRRQIVPADETDEGRRVADFVEATLAAIPNFAQTLEHILDAIGKGLSVLEVMWQVGADGRIGIREIKSRYPGRFAFDTNHQLCLSRQPSFYHRWRYASLEPLPERKFLVCTFGSQYSNPYGKGLLARAFWYYWFKRNNLKFWLVYNERFGLPLTVARGTSALPDEERARLIAILETLQDQTGILLPDDVTLEFLESRSHTGGGTYQDFADWCNDEISKIVLGQTLTSSEGRRSGSLALGRVHDQVRNEYIESDARILMETINGQLIPWIVHFNFAPGTACPRWVIDLSADDDLDKEIEIDRRLIALGVPLSSEYFYERYRRPAPREQERALRYDDQNLFQYHMRFGVLTVNEVRERLGLAPVAWGNERVRLPDADQGLQDSQVESGGSDESILEIAGKPIEIEPKTR